MSAADGKGLVIGSIAARSPFPNRSILLYRKIGDSGESYFQPGAGELIAAELPVGDYEFTSWRVTVEDGSIIPAKPFRIGFRVTSGRAAYLGSYDFQLTLEPAGTTQFGSSAPNSKWVVEVTCTDQSAHDMRIFATRYPAVSQQGVSTIQPQECRRNLGDGSRYYAQRLRLGPELGL